jgi:hypothetical protein
MRCFAVACVLLMSCSKASAPEASADAGSVVEAGETATLPADATAAAPAEDVTLAQDSTGV